MNRIDFQTPQRQSIFGILFFLLLAIRKSITAFWPLIVIYLIKGDQLEEFKTYILAGAILIIAILVVHSIFSYRHFFFYIENNEFILKKGYLKRVTLAIPFDKIVSINQNQNVIQQLIGVVELEIDSVGSKKKEIKISALNKQVANRLQELLSTKLVSSEDSTEETDTKNNNSTVFKLDIADLIRVGLTRNHLRGIAIVLAFGGNIFQQLDEIFKDEIGEVAKQTGVFFEKSDLTLIIALFILLVIISFLISMIETVLFYFNLNLKKTDKAFTLTSGLLKRKNITVPFSRIQAFRQSTNPLQKLAGISTISLSQANSSESNRKKEKVNIPGCNSNVLLKTRNSVFGNEGFDEFETLKPNIAFLRRRIIFGAVIPSMLSLLLLMENYWFAILSLAILLFGIWVSCLSWKKRLYKINPNYLMVTHGAFAKREVIIEHFKTQSVHLKQSIF